MKSQVLHTVWCNISCEAAGEIWNWSLLGVKGLTRQHDHTGMALISRALEIQRRTMKQYQLRKCPGTFLRRASSVIQFGAELIWQIKDDYTTNSRTSLSHFLFERLGECASGTCLYVGGAALLLQIWAESSLNTASCQIFNLVPRPLDVLRVSLARGLGWGGDDWNYFQAKHGRKHAQYDHNPLENGGHK